MKSDCVAVVSIAAASHHPPSHPAVKLVLLVACVGQLTPLSRRFCDRLIVCVVLSHVFTQVFACCQLGHVQLHVHLYLHIAL